ncbi:hypothetical protein ACHQM5_002241 [Ranunculus cassubicifolius]
MNKKSHPLELLEASFNGDLHRLKLELAVELDDGKGIAKTVGEIKDEVGIRAIHVAAVEGQLHVLKYLIGDLKLDVDVKDIRGSDFFFWYRDHIIFLYMD